MIIEDLKIMGIIVGATVRSLTDGFKLQGALVVGERGGDGRRSLSNFIVQSQPMISSWDGC